MPDMRHGWGDTTGACNALLSRLQGNTLHTLRSAI